MDMVPYEDIQMEIGEAVTEATMGMVSEGEMHTIVEEAIADATLGMIPEAEVQVQIDQAIADATIGMIPEAEFAGLEALAQQLIEMTYYRMDASYELDTYGGMIGRTLKKKFTDGNTGTEHFELEDCKKPGFIHNRAVKVLNEEWAAYLEVIENIRSELE